MKAIAAAMLPPTANPITSDGFFCTLLLGNEAEGKNSSWPLLAAGRGGAAEAGAGNRGRDGIFARSFTLNHLL